MRKVKCFLFCFEVNILAQKVVWVSSRSDLCFEVLILLLLLSLGAKIQESPWENQDSRSPDDNDVVEDDLEDVETSSNEIKSLCRDMA